jgi:subtilisin family serine protease
VTELTKKLLLRCGLRLGGLSFNLLDLAEILHDSGIASWMRGNRLGCFLSERRSGRPSISCLSPDSAPDPENLIDKYFITAGTSMACPFISGVVGLLLERDPTLDPAGVKALLEARSKIPGVAAGTFDPNWGFGLLNAQNL